jgi:hypothetical protein
MVGFDRERVQATSSSSSFVLTSSGSGFHISSYRTGRRIPMLIVFCIIHIERRRALFGSGNVPINGLLGGGFGHAQHLGAALHILSKWLSETNYRIGCHVSPLFVDLFGLVKTAQGQLPFQFGLIQIDFALQYYIK